MQIVKFNPFETKGSIGDHNYRKNERHNPRRNSSPTTATTIARKSADKTSPPRFRSSKKHTKATYFINIADRTALRRYEGGGCRSEKKSPTGQ